MKKILCSLALTMAMVSLSSCDGNEIPNYTSSDGGSSITENVTSENQPSSESTPEIVYSPLEKLIIGAVQLQNGSFYGDFSIYDETNSIIDFNFDLGAHIAVDNTDDSVEVQGTLEGQIFNADIKLDVSYYNNTIYMFSSAGKAKMSIDSAERIKFLIEQIADQFGANTPETNDLNFSNFNFNLDDLLTKLDEMEEEETEEGILLTLILVDGYDIKILLENNDSYKLKRVEVQGASLGSYDFDLSLGIEYLVTNPVAKIDDEEEYLDIAPSFEILDTISKFIDSPLLNVDLSVDVYQLENNITNGEENQGEVNAFDAVDEPQIDEEQTEILTYDIDANAQLDINNNHYYANVDVIEGENEHHAEAQYLEDVLYLSYNTMKVALSRESISDIINVILSIAGVEVENSLNGLNKFLGNLGLNSENINEFLNSLDLKDVVTFKYTENEIYLAVDSNSFGLDGLFELSVPRDGSGLNYVKAHVVTETQRVEVVLTADTEVAIPELLIEDYQDWSSMSELMELIKNTASLTDFHITGDLTMSLLSIFNLIVGTDIRVRVNEDNSTSVAVKLNIPLVTGINGSGLLDTKKVEKRISNIYIENGMVYIHRIDSVSVKVGSVFKPNSYEYYDSETSIMVTLEEFTTNILDYIEIIFGFNSTTMNLIRNNVDQGESEDKTINYDQIISSFQKTQDGYYNIVVNLNEILKKSMFGDLSATLVGDGTYLTKMSVETKIIFKIVGDLSLNNPGGEVDFGELREFVDNYEFGEGELHQADIK